MKRALFPLLSVALGVLLVDAAHPALVDHSLLYAARRHTTSSEGSIGAGITRLTGPHRASTGDSAVAFERLARGGAGTYIGDILDERDSAVVRWPDRQGVPLVVWVQPDAPIPDFGSDFAAAVRDAFAAWNDVRLPVRFAFTDDSAAADVHVSWIDRFDEPISGRTRWANDDRWQITDANIVLAVHHSSGDALDPDAVRAMALHEVGHLLGLDHTTDTLSVMAPRVRVRELSRADRATARLLYTLPTGLLR